MSYSLQKRFAHTYYTQCMRTEICRDVVCIAMELSGMTQGNA